jgi:hypothetical protein
VTQYLWKRSCPFSLTLIKLCLPGAGGFCELAALPGGGGSGKHPCGQEATPQEEVGSSTRTGGVNRGCEEIGGVSERERLVEEGSEGRRDRERKVESGKGGGIGKGRWDREREVGSGKGGGIGKGRWDLEREVGSEKEGGIGKGRWD